MMSASPKDNRLPTFFLIGEAKSGTTTLAQHLRNHPDVFLTDPKEPNFFTDDEQYSLGLEFYLNRYFVGAEPFSAKGEATLGCFHNGEKVIKRLKALYPCEAPKMIVLLRHPVTRSWSQYRDRVRTAEETETFDAANLKEGSAYFQDSLYAAKLEPWIEAFGREAFLVLTLDELSRDPELILRLVWSHIRVCLPSDPIENLHANIAAEAKSKFLMKAINPSGSHKRLLRALIPRHVRRQLITRLRNVNIREASVNVGPELKLVEQLLNPFEQDINKLDVLTGLSFPNWRIGPNTSKDNTLTSKRKIGVR